MPVQKAFRLTVALGIVGLSASVAYGQLGALSNSLIKPDVSKVTALPQTPKFEVQKAISDGTVNIVRPILDASEKIEEIRVELETSQGGDVLPLLPVVKPARLGFASLAGTKKTSLPFHVVPDENVSVTAAVLSFTDRTNDEVTSLGNMDEESAFETEPVLKPQRIAVQPRTPVRTVTRKVTRQSLSTVWISGAYR